MSLSNPESEALLGQLGAILVALQAELTPQSTNKLGVRFKSDKGPLVKELAAILKLAIASGLFTPDILSETFIAEFGTQVGLVYRASASGQNDACLPASTHRCPHCEGKVMVIESEGHPEIRKGPV